LVARTEELGIRLSIDMSDGVIENRIDELKKKVKIIHEESKEVASSTYWNRQIYRKMQTIK
jgi:hypothetical protein